MSTDSKKRQSKKRRRRERRRAQREKDLILPAQKEEQERLKRGQKVQVSGAKYLADRSHVTVSRRMDTLIECLRLYPEETAKELATRPEAHWLPGQLYLVGVLNRDQLDAAFSFDTLRRHYQAALNRYGSILTANIGEVKGSSYEDLSPAAERKFRRLRNKYNYRRDVLISCGTDVHTVVLQLIEHERLPTPEKLPLLQRGLAALAVLGR